MRTIKIILQYDGTNYHGWQIQPNGLSIQEVLQDKIEVITGEKAAVHGAGRTDAGVHALGQVACFATASRLDAPVVKRALNSLLPKDIRITDASFESKGFHPRFSAKAKRYFYLIVNSAVISPFMCRYAWQVPYGLNIGNMGEAAEILTGRHDFASFVASGCNARTTQRTIFSLEILTGETGVFGGIAEDMVRVTIEADGFLRYMARNIVGTLIEVGKGRMAAGAMRDVILSGDRRKAGPTAPARGLFLEKVIY